MRRKLISLTLCFVLLLGPESLCLANETAGTETLTNEPIISHYTLSLNDAIKMAIERDSVFDNHDITIQDAEKQLEKAKKNMRDAEKLVVKLPAGIDSLAMKKGFYVTQSQIALDNAKKAREQEEKKIAYSMTETYFSIKNLEATLSILDSSYKLAENNYNVAKQQFALGIIAEIDLQNAEIALNELNNNKESTKRSYELLLDSFRIKLNVDNPQCTFSLTDNIETPTFASDYLTDSKNALSTRFDLFSAQKGMEQANTYRDIMSVLGTNSSYYSSANKSAEVAANNLKNTEKLITLAIKGYYYDILNAKENLDLLTKKAEIAQKKYNMVSVKFELGAITHSELSKELIDYNTAVCNLENAKLKYKLAVEKYNYEITIGL